MTPIQEGDPSSVSASERAEVRSGEKSDPDERRRRDLAEFLRRRRARLDPVVLGLPPRTRRRTPGLRREDVAERAGMSVAWYTSLEQGRPVKPSRRVVAALAEALQLSDVDRAHLHELTGYPPPATGGAPPADIETLQRLVDQLKVPAYCTDALTNVIAWNSAAVDVFGDYGQWSVANRNVLRLLFEQATFGSRIVDRDDYAAKVVNTFRGRSDTYLQDPEAIDLVDSLARRYPRFRALWESQNIARTDTDTLLAELPVGRRTYTQVNLQGVTGQSIRFHAFVPIDPPVDPRADPRVDPGVDPRAALPVGAA